MVRGLGPRGKQLNFTRAFGFWDDRFWNTAPAELSKNTVSVEIPRKATVCYINVIDENGLVSSSEPVKLQGAGFQQMS